MSAPTPIALADQSRHQDCLPSPTGLVVLAISHCSQNIEQ